MVNLRIAALISVMLPVVSIGSMAQHAPTVAIEKGPGGFLVIPDGIGSYFLIRCAPTAQSPFDKAGMTLSDEGLHYAFQEGENMGFFDAEAISVFSPRDTDFDGIDDLHELGKNLDPLDPADALAPSLIAGLTNLEEYRLTFGLSSAKPQYYSREVSTFNFGAPRGAFEAISREQSIFNFGGSRSFEANSRELSVYNGERPPIEGYPQIYSREQSVFNFGGAKLFEAHSREISIFNGERLPTAGYAQVYSRETSVFNGGAPRARLEAISREVSIFNNISQ